MKYLESIFLAMFVLMAGCGKEPQVQNVPDAELRKPDPVERHRAETARLRQSVDDAQLELVNLEQLKLDFIKTWSAENEGKPPTPEMRARYKEMTKTFESRKKAALEAKLNAEEELMKLGP